MADLPVAPQMTAQAALAALALAGWQRIGTGDWSWVLEDPSGGLAARVTPFDPAYRLHAEACLAGPPNRWLPRVEAIAPLQGDGYVVVMERLWPAEEAAAADLCARLAIGNDCGYQTPAPVSADADPDLDDLRDRILGLMDEGARRYQLWGGSDIRPGNIMADAQGRLKLVDPLFLAGKKVVAAIVEGRADLLADFTQRQLEAFLTIPPFAPGPETDALRRRLTDLYA